MYYNHLVKRLLSLKITTNFAVEIFYGGKLETTNFKRSDGRKVTQF